MVGVAGKFKGCNTCRHRRVKCDNSRPHCRKCVDSGRQCGGYARERVFIVGTAVDRGRCSSHPRRSLLVPKSTKAKAKVKVKSKRESNVVDSAGVELETHTPDAEPRCLALQTNLDLLEGGYWPDVETFIVPATSLEQGLSRSSSVLGLGSMDGEFEMRAVCLHDGGDTNRILPSSNFNSSPPIGKFPPTCLFVYEIGSSSSNRSSLSVKVEPGLPDPLSLTFQSLLGGNFSKVQQDGAAYYSSFPQHYFFARLFRTHLTFYALTHRRPTFLASDEWCSMPWRRSFKTNVDSLFDIFVRLPEIFARGEELETHPPSIKRCLQARALLDQCNNIDNRLENWMNNLTTNDDGPLWWEERTIETIVDSYQTSGTSPWLPGSQLGFKNAATVEILLYYWAGLCTFHRAVQHIYAICMAEIPDTSSPLSDRTDTEYYNNAVMKTTTPLITQILTPPRQLQEQETIFGAGWNHQAFMPVSAAASSMPTPYMPDPLFTEFGPDSFISPTGFAPEIPAEFDYTSQTQAFLPSNEFNPYIPTTSNFDASSQAIYALEPTFLIPATPASAASSSPGMSLRASTFPPLTPTYSMPYSTQPLNLDPIPYLLSSQNVISRSNASTRAHSFPHSRTTSYLHSRSPTPTAFSTTPSSNPSGRTSLSNPTSNPVSMSNSNSNSTGGGYNTTPSPSTLDPLVGSNRLPPQSAVPPLDVKHGEENISKLATNIMRGMQYLSNSSSEEKVAHWHGSPAIGIATREAIKVFRRQGRATEVELCKNLLRQSMQSETPNEVTGRTWREYGRARGVPVRPEAITNTNWRTENDGKDWERMGRHIP